jgi:hypothetical protein
MLIIKDPIVTVKCRTAIKMLFLYFNLCLSIMFDSLSSSFTSISFLTNFIVSNVHNHSYIKHSPVFALHNVISNFDSSFMFVWKIYLILIQCCKTSHKNVKKKIYIFSQCKHYVYITYSPHVIYYWTFWIHKTPGRMEQSFTTMMITRLRVNTLMLML